jgi:hypothetical protein
MDLIDLITVALPAPVKLGMQSALFGFVGRNAAAERHLDRYLTCRAYRRAFGREADLDHPATFNERIIVRKLYERRPIFSVIADKLGAREIAADRIGNAYLPVLHLVCDSVEEIDFDRLPDRFVIKTNHGSGWKMIVGDKKTLDTTAARQTIGRWMKTNYYLRSRERFYRDIRPRILVEELLQERSGAPAIDYKFYVFDGIPEFFHVDRGRFVGHRRNFYDRACKRIPVSLQFPNFDDDFEFPANMEAMFDIAGKLGRGFDFIRVDLYCPGGRPMFGEFTSLPVGGINLFEPPIYDEIFGRSWKLAARAPGNGEAG